MTIALLLVGLVGVAGFFLYTVPHVAEHNRALREKRANCSHDWVEFNVMNDVSFPARQCRRCGLQEHLNRCLHCGKAVERKGPNR